jgi:hypothetical protein
LTVGYRFRLRDQPTDEGWYRQQCQQRPDKRPVAVRGDAGWSFWACQLGQDFHSCDQIPFGCARLTLVAANPDSDYRHGSATEFIFAARDKLGNPDEHSN